MASSIRAAIHYAWRGSGTKWDAVPLQIIGGGIGGLVFLLWGVKLPQEILDNPALSGIIAIAIGGVSGVAIVFLLRLCWWPFHVRFQAHGGLHVFLRDRLGDFMWPVLLTAGGLLGFIVLTGAGVIWLSIAVLRMEPAIKNAETPNTIGNPDFSLSAPTARYRFKWDPENDLAFDFRLDTDRDPNLYSNPAFGLRNLTNTVAYRVIVSWKSETAMDIDSAIKRSGRLSKAKFTHTPTRLIIGSADGAPYRQGVLYYLEGLPPQIISAVAKQDEVYFPEKLKPLAGLYLVDKIPDKIGETSAPFIAVVTLEWETSQGKRQRSYRVRVSATNAKADDSGSPVVEAFLNFSVEEIPQ